ncbi:MAG: DEAD/DEAH box helicase family protein [Gemmataceae bacterium]
MSVAPIHLVFDAGTLVASGGSSELLASLPGFELDSRTDSFRAEARAYRRVVEYCLSHNLAYVDQARSYQKTPWPLRTSRDPFPHQREAIDAWMRHRSQGVVVLPTGTGKTFVAILAIHRSERPSLVIAPTIDLMSQWYGELRLAFDVPVGLLGGGYHDIQPLTVTTYDSAHLYVERWGNRFGLLIFDECHHLPGPTYLASALGSLAPYRLGLTATPERTDGNEALLDSLIGPIVYRREIKELAGDFLAEYRTERLYVELNEDEAAAYQQARDHYRGFCGDRGINMASPTGWQRFIQESSRSREGRAAFQAYQDQRRLALAAPAKLQLLEKLLHRHRTDRVLIFTYDNATVYEIARRYLVPAITHQTKTKERKEILDGFQCGELSVVVTSRVLNEGVDVPAANVGIVLSGTSTVREHVQRLGRLLRKHGDKQATLIEVVTRGTVEEFITQRRRQHHAYE